MLETQKPKAEQLFKKYWHLMCHIAMEILQNPADAEDAAQQALLYLLSHMDKLGDKYACIDFYYNYFEEECWENAGFSSETQCLYSNKIGRRIFNRVMRALYILQELYSEAPCFPHIDGQLFDATDELG